MSRLTAQSETVSKLKWLRLITLATIPAFAAPPLFGMMIIVLVLLGDVSPWILHSTTVTSIALVIGVVLILLPMRFFLTHPERYAAYITDLERRLARLALTDDVENK